MNDDRPAVYEENGKIVYRASSLGHCTKMLAATRMGYEPSPPPPAMLELFERGQKAEDAAIKLLKARDWQVKNRQKEYDLQLSGRLVVRVHVDGLVASGTPLEIKSQSVEEFAKGRTGHLWDAYNWQFSAIMHATGLKLIVVRFNRDEPKDPASIAIDVLEDPPYTRARLLQRVIEVERTAFLGVLPESCEVLEYPCPMYRLHPAVVDESEKVTDPAVDDHAKTYVDARAKEKHWKEIKDAARRFLRLHILGDDVRTLSGYRVRFRDQPRTTVSEKLMRDKGWDPDEVKETTYVEYIDVDEPREDKGAPPADAEG